MEREAIATLCGVLSGFFIALAFVIRHCIIKGYFDRKKGKNDK